MLRRRLARRQEEVELDAGHRRGRAARRCRRRSRRCTVDEQRRPLLRRAGRGDPRATRDVLIGASPRGSLALVLTARALRGDRAAATT